MARCKHGPSVTESYHRRPHTPLASTQRRETRRLAPFVLTLATFILSAFATTMTPFASKAGPNENGVLLLHLEAEVIYTADSSYCGLPLVSDRDSVVTRVDTLEPVVISILAAFPDSISPRVAGLSFGLAYHHSVNVIDYGTCADLALPTSNWPGQASGIAMVWTTAITDTISRVAWIVAESEIEVGHYLHLVSHPTQGAYFADDSIPAVLDEVSCLGTLGFYVDGYRCDTPVASVETTPRQPTAFVYPNPASASATITFGDNAILPDRVHIVNANGRSIRVLAPVGRTMTWDLRDNLGSPIPQGVYYVRTAPYFMDTAIVVSK